jgi:hypothetical protein
LWNWSALAAGLALVLLLVACGPLFVCMPPWVDSAFFDLCARTLLGGGILYHDVFLHGLPGTALLQTGLRLCIGWSSEALQIADLVFLAISIALVMPIIQRKRPLGARLWTATALFGFYFSTSEWCHCEVDPWMMPLALAAMLLRGGRSGQSAESNPSQRSLLPLAVLEGLCWAYDFAMKPFIVFPAGACWLVTAFQAWRGGHQRRRWLSFDTLGVLGGAGIGIGALVLWLWRSDNLLFFLDASTGSWNQDYYSSSPLWISRIVKLFYGQGVWGVVHVFAIPVAIFSAGEAMFGRRRGKSFPENLVPLLAALYLGWLYQANFLQRQLIYQMVPSIFFAIALLASRRWPRLALALLRRSRKLRVASVCYLAGLLAAYYATYFAWAGEADLIHRDPWLTEMLLLIFTQWYVTFAILTLLMALVASPRLLGWLVRWMQFRLARFALGACLLYCLLAQIPLLNPARLEYWPRCWREGSTPFMRNVLTLESDRAAPDWIALEEVKKFLRSRDVRSRELTCYAVSAIHLYKEMELRPSTRFILLWPALIFFPEHRKQIGWELAMSPQRFVVSDLCQEGFSRENANIDDPSQPFGFPPCPLFQSKNFPWTQPLVFRAGRYLVHRTIPGGRPVFITNPGTIGTTLPGQ